MGENVRRRWEATKGRMIRPGTVGTYSFRLLLTSLPVQHAPRTEGEGKREHYGEGLRHGCDGKSDRGDERLEQIQTSDQQLERADDSNECCDGPLDSCS